MKHVLYSALLLMMTIVACENPTFISDCEFDRNDNAYSAYLKDAEQLVLRRITIGQLPEIDDITLSQADIDRVLEALAAVYHAAEHLNAADKVINDHKIHTLQTRSLNSVILYIDSSYEWTQEWVAGNTLTGNSDVDKLINTYNLTLKTVMDGGDWLVLEAANTLNTGALAKAFEMIEGVSLASPDGVVGDGDNITMLEYGTEIVLQYSTGEGDCPSGCISHKYWNFKVYEDCEVEFWGRSEDPL